MSTVTILQKSDHVRVIPYFIFLCACHIHCYNPSVFKFLDVFSVVFRYVFIILMWNHLFWNSKTKTIPVIQLLLIPYFIQINTMYSISIVCQMLQFVYYKNLSYIILPFEAILCVYLKAMKQTTFSWACCGHMISIIRMLIFVCHCFVRHVGISDKWSPFPKLQASSGTHPSSWDNISPVHFFKPSNWIGNWFKSQYGCRMKLLIRSQNATV